MSNKNTEKLKRLLRGLTDYSKEYSKLTETIDELPPYSLEELYKKMFGLPKKKLIPSDEEIRRSILDYARAWPERMREHASAILESCPKPPRELGNL